MRIRAEFELLLSSGIRATELENMNREDVDFSDHSVFVRKGKGNKQRVTFINSVCEHLLSSGIRATELENMNREDVDFSDHSVFVRKGKGNKQRVTFINSVCEHYLRLYLETRDDSDDCLFRNRKHNRVNKDGLEYDLRLLGQLANVKNVHPHRCRRTFATSMYKKGMDIHNIQKLLAHTNINTTMEYITTDEERIKTEYRCYS